MCRALPGACGLLSFEKEARMTKRSCRNCVYALRPEGRWLRIILSRWAGLLICFNHADCPGRMQGVLPDKTCRNWA